MSGLTHASPASACRANLSADTRAGIIAMLRDGYGAEDIAVRLRQHVTLVRVVVADLRRAGVFRQPGFFESPAFGSPRRT